MKNILKTNPWLGYVLALVAGLVIGGLVFRSCGNSTVNETSGKEDAVWTCSMDPQVKQPNPGKCPICGMDLIKMKKGETPTSNIDPNAVMLSDEALALANVETEIVGTPSGHKEIRLFGKIEPDQRLQQSQSAYVGGRIERLMINAVGDHVTKGQTIAVIYSPELYTAEQELASTLRSASPLGPSMNSQLIDAAIEKLRLLNIPQSQIDEVINSQKASPYVHLKANTTGTVVKKMVEQGDYVKQGESLMQVANLSRVWAVFQAYETDLPFVHKGQQVTFSAEALPGETFTGHVVFVDPVLNGQTRTAGVRVELSNPSGRFMPEMLLVGHVAASMQKYADEGVIIPKSAVLWTGKRSVVYVKDDVEEQPTFLLRQVTLGPSLPDGYVVLDGLAEGEEIVTNGVFAIDAAAQLDGKRSMMSQ
jgi:Cu(I)/Ag(I) efflux system membrane fusion protein